jgi:hypothetical protein
MSKKDYVAIAAAIRAAIASVNDREPVMAIVNAIASCMQRDTSRFDRARFVAGCGVEE